MAEWLTAHEALINVALINVLLALGMHACMATGLMSLAGTGFMASGAYAGGLAASRAGIPFEVSLLIATLVGGALAAVVSIPVIRLRTHYLAIATLAFSLVISTSLQTWPSVSGGAAGLITVPRWTTTVSLLAAVGIVASAFESIFRSETGRVMVGIRNDEYLCRANGVSTGYHKFLMLVVSGMLSGLAGGMYAHFTGVLEPTDFREDRVFAILSFTILGGVWHWSGSAIGAVVLTSIPEFLRVFAQYRLILTGVVLLVVVMVLPRGILQPKPFRLAQQRLAERRRSRTPQRKPARSSASPSRELPATRNLTGNEKAPALGAAVAVERIEKSFGGVNALQGVTIELKPGLIYGLIGPNGSGKTTLLNIVNGFVRPDSGNVRFDANAISLDSPVRVARFGVARTFQSPRVLEEATVHDNVLLGCHRLRRAGAIESSVQSPRARRESSQHNERVWAALAKVGLIELAHAEAGELSFGQQRLVELARVLVSNSRLVILDEPTAGVNPVMIDKLAEWVREPIAARPTYLIAEHNIDFVMEVCDYVFVLDNGSILAEGLPKDVRLDERVVEAYLGSST